MTIAHLIPPPKTPAASPVATLPVHTLLCHKHVDFALTCLASLLHYSADPLSLVIHDDGSLTPDDLARLHVTLHAPHIIPRPEADARMHALLHPFPALQRFRAHNLFALKILDIALLSNDPLIAYCDADVLFLKPFSNLFHIPPGAGGIAMQDAESCYSIRSWHLLRSPSLRLAKDLNAGITCLHRASVDLPLLESFLQNPASLTKKYFTEQTCWAILAHAHRFHAWDSSQLCFPFSSSYHSAVGLHVVGNSRHLLQQLANAHRHDAPVAAIRTVPFHTCRFSHLASYETLRILSRLYRKIKK